MMRKGLDGVIEEVLKYWQQEHNVEPARSAANINSIHAAISKSEDIPALATIVQTLSLNASLTHILSQDPTFNDWRPHHVTVGRLQLSIKEPIDYQWLSDKTFGSFGHLQEWIDRYADALKTTFLASINELKTLEAPWHIAEARPKAKSDVPFLHSELMSLRPVSEQMNKGRFALPPVAYESVSHYEPQRAMALSACRSWCMYNGLPSVFDGLAIVCALSSGDIEAVISRIKAETQGGLDPWRQLACAPFLVPKVSVGNAPPANSDDHMAAHYMMSEHQMPVNSGYPLPPHVFEDYARLCYRFVVSHQHPTYVRSDRYSPYSNIILAWYFQKELSVNEISRQLGIAKSTTQRLLDKLIELYNHDLPEGAKPLKKRLRAEDIAALSDSEA